MLKKVELLNIYVEIVIHFHCDSLINRQFGRTEFIFTKKAFVTLLYYILNIFLGIFDVIVSLLNKNINFLKTKQKNPTVNSTNK